ncbi:hypothetical protein DSECCO2_185850 [anaerobic digester metagenome]
MFFVEINHQRYKRPGLRKHGSHCSSCNAPLKDHDKQQIKNDVGKRGNNQKIERGFRIAQAAQHRACSVKSEEKKNPCKINLHIKGRLRNYLLRQPDEPEDRFTESDAKYSDQQ